MQGVRGVRCDGRVTAGGVKALGREFGAIGSVNHVVRNTRMVRMLLKQGIKYGNSFLEICSSVDLFLRERHQGERIEGTEFHIVRRLRARFFKGCGVSLAAVDMSHF